MADAMLELREMSIWLLWRLEVVNGKETKKPFAATGGSSGTDAKYRSTWVTYEEAVKASKRFCSSGVGFVTPEGCFFLDIDHKELTDPLVQTLLDRFDSYTERSVSGTGFHIYGKCDLSQLPIITDNSDNEKKWDKMRYYMKNPHNGLELYIGGLTNRFAVYTGNVILDKPLQDCTSAILTTLDKNMRKRKKAKYSETRNGDCEVFDIVANLRKQKNGEKFKRLYDDGDTTGYSSHSEADAALCAMLAFRTGNDPDTIDAAFRTSALYREKWEREDYRAWTIEAGVEACYGVFHSSVMPHPEFIKFDPKTKEPYVSPPLLAKYIRNNLHYILVRDNARQGILIYVYERGCYRLYAPEMLKGIIKSYITVYNEEFVSMGKVNEVYNQLITDLNYVNQDALNADEDLINFQNGLLRLSDETLLPHSSDILSTIQIPCNWTGKPSPTPMFDSYMDTLTDGDVPTQNLLLEYDGTCLSNVKGWRMKKALFSVGAGDTGKSLGKSLVELMLGKGNFVGIDLKDIEARFGTGAIYGMRLAGSSDMSFLSVDELKTFKKVTGGDSLFAEFKGQQAFEFTYNGLLWFCMNRLPKFGGDDGKWVYDRIMVVECKNVIPKEKQDKCLLDKMYAERDGIMYKAIMALKTVIANGYCFSEPESVTQARDTYMNENNTVIAFHNECMTKWPDGKIKGCTTGKVYDVYKAWCSDNNSGYAKTAKEFRMTLAEHLGTTFKDMTVRRGEGGTFYKNFTLTQEAMEQYRKAYGYDGSEFLS